MAGALVVNRVTFAIKNHCDKSSENYQSFKVKRPNNSRQAATQIFQVLIIRALNIILCWARWLGGTVVGAIDIVLVGSRHENCNLIRCDFLGNIF